MHVLEHVPKPENPLREFFRVMKKRENFIWKLQINVLFIRPA